MLRWVAVVVYLHVKIRAIARQGRNGAVSVIALAERGALFDPGPCMCGMTRPALAESRDGK